MRKTKRVKTILECLDVTTNDGNGQFAYAKADHMVGGKMSVSYIGACLEVYEEGSQLASIRRTLVSMVNAGLIEKSYFVAEPSYGDGLPQRVYYYNLPGMREHDEQYYEDHKPPSRSLGEIFGGVS